ncbi:MAG: M23 family metallopeptidase [Bacteroidota bacterium]
MTKNQPEKTTITTKNPFAFFEECFKKKPDFIAKGFDFPVGKPNASGYYNAQKFQVNDHLGDDWNGTGGGNTDLGDPIYAIGNGYVKFAEDYGGGWGNVIRIVHQYKGKYYESLCAHCDTMLVKKGDFVKKGAKIGTIGDADGAYYAHLHFEIRDDIFMEIGGGYSKNTKGFLDPTKFIKSNRN